MMSAAGTPSTDPWVVVPRERARYEEQFKSLKPNNGIITGEQAKGFFLQSQLPPIVLSEIWSLADTDADGKMDINEFSIACKLINLKLRGYEVPKVAPPSLLASLKVHSPPPSLPPPRPEPPKVVSQPPAPALPAQPLIQPNAILPNLTGSLLQQQPQQPVAMIPTGIVPPLQANAMIPTISNIAPQQQPLIGGVPLTAVTCVPVQQQPGYVPPSMPMNVVPPMMSTTVAPISTAQAGSPAGSLTGSLTGSITGSLSSSINAPNTTVPIASSTPRASLDGQMEWSVPHQTKLKYTQIFNTTDRTRSGFLTGAQARNVMVQTKLPQNVLAMIWALSDMDLDGRLGCEEFVLAMHLCEQAASGIMPPIVLPPDLIPPSFRRSARTASVSSQGSVHQQQQQQQQQQTQDIDAGSSISQTTFEDKRKENYEKGQAELDRRRKTLLDQQRKEAEERDRKDREEADRKEKARLEAEKRRLDELEQQMREQRELERAKEEERKRQAEQREAARKEMERQRQLEWEKQRLQELQQQRQREQETVLKLKAKNQSLTIELSSLNDQVKALSQRICDTRVGVSNVKTTIDGMRTTRDAQMQEMSQLKNKLKEQNAKLLALSQEKAKLDAKNKLNAQMNDASSTDRQQRQAFENKEITIKNLREKIDDMRAQIDGKMNDIENNNTQLTDLKTQLAQLVVECECLYGTYEEKKCAVLALKCTTNNNNRNVDFSAAWKDNTSSAWGDATTAATTTVVNETTPAAAWPSADWPTNVEETASSTASVALLGNVCKYRALYEFVARNSDEISFQPGDIVNVPYEQTGEPGWLAGEIRGRTGWFPESYVEPLDGVGVRADESVQQTSANDRFADESITRLEGIAEETSLETQSAIPSSTVVEDRSAIAAAADDDESSTVEYYIASYPYQSVEPGDLTFNAGEIITVLKKDGGDWWTGKIGDNVGIFPSNYVQKYDAAQAAAVETATVSTANDGTVAVSSGTQHQQQQQDTANANVSLADNEVSQINETRKELEHAFAEAANGTSTGSATNTQTLTRSGSKKPEIASVIAPYQASSPEQLSLQRGQLIMIRKKAESGWWEGELQAKGRKRQVGWFPASYVKVLNSTGRASGRTTPVSTTRIQQEVVIDKVVALFPYTAANPDELSFLKDDIISVTSRDEQAWWRGELNGVSGLFPSNYVTPLGGAAPSGGNAPIASMHESNDNVDRTIEATDDDVSNNNNNQSVVDGNNNKKRRDCVNELIQTERAYVDDMSIVYRVFEVPMRESRGAVTTADVDRIFGNWQELIRCNREFLDDILKRTEASTTTTTSPRHHHRHRNRRESNDPIIGDVICNHLPKMSAYIKFCSKQLEGAALLQRLTESSLTFRDLMKRCQGNVEARGMPLSSFLIKPMQRITKYPLLIGKILENTPETHPDYKHLQDALSASDRFLKTINETVRAKETEERLDWLQAHVQQNDLGIKFNSRTNRMGQRKLLHHGTLTKMKSGKELLAFLTNDFLLLVQPSKSLQQPFNFPAATNVTYKMYKQPLFVHEMVTSRTATESDGSGSGSGTASNGGNAIESRSFKVQDDKQTISLTAPTVNELHLWLKRIDAAKEAYNNNNNNNPHANNGRHNHRRIQRQKSSSKSPSVGVLAATSASSSSTSSPSSSVPCGRLLVLVRSGKRLIRAGKSYSDNVYCMVSLGDQKQYTDVARDNANGNNVGHYHHQTNGSISPPVPTLIWNATMQFPVKDLKRDRLRIDVYEMCLFTPDEFLGNAEVRVGDVYEELGNSKRNGPLVKRLILHQVESGEIEVKLDLQVFERSN